MARTVPNICLQFVVIALLVTGFTRPAHAEAVRGAVATVHPLATQAALDTYAQGGNAIDAAVAAAVTLGVVDGHNSGIGGGCFMLIRTADGEMIALDGREMAPGAATRDMYLRDGKADTNLSQTGPLAIGVPGSLLAYDHALNQFGNRTLADVLLPAAEIAEEGFEIDAIYAQKIQSTLDKIKQFEATRKLLLDDDGSPLEEGETLKQPDLARSYRAIAEQGTGWFYKGDYPKQLEAWMKANGGILTAEDFAAYEMKARMPILSDYRGYTIVGYPPPSSGGLHVAQILSMLETFDIAALKEQGPGLREHVMLEAMKLAFADRAYWLGDPDFANVPTGLIDPGYAREQAAKIKLDTVLEVEGAGTPPGVNSEFFDDDFTGRHTTHIATADEFGNVVALTTTVNTAFGSKVIIPGTGIILNNQMDDFSAEPGVPNAFGLIGAEANAIEPRKRPLSSMSPTIVLKDGEPVLTLGAAGGPKIITQVVLAITNIIDLGDDVQTALERPRFHHQWKPDAALVEDELDEAIVEKLKALGHTIEISDSAGATQAIAILPDGRFVPVHEPRVPGSAAVQEAGQPAEPVGAGAGE